MRKLSEYKNEEAIELLADLFMPVCEILSSNEVALAFKNGEKPVRIIAVAMKANPKACVDMLKVLNGSDDVEINVLTAPKMMLEILNDKELMSFFAEQGKTIGGNAFGSVTENTEAVEEA